MQIHARQVAPPWFCQLHKKNMKLNHRSLMVPLSSLETGNVEICLLTALTRRDNENRNSVPL